MSQARLLHIVGGSSFGGAAKLILRLAQKMTAEGWQVDILTTDPVFQEAARRQGVGVVALDVIRREIRPWWDLRGMIRLYRFLRRERYMVVHTHTSKAGFVGRLAAWLAGAPVVLHTLHGFAFHERTPRATRTFYSTLERLAARWCDRIIAVTEFHRRWALELGICREENIVAVPNGIAIPQPSGAAMKVRRGWNVQPGELILLTAGRLAPEKGLEDLIEAAAMLQSAGRPFRVILAGDGPMRAQLEALAENRGAAGRVAFLGYREDVADLLAACDLVVLPSVREGLSIALLEAMAAGKPIVATRIGGNLAVAGQEEMALLVPPGDPKALADAILRYWRDPALRHRLGAKARLIFEDRYTEDRMLNSYREVYLDLMQATCSADTSSASQRRTALGIPRRADS
jgi:glycosyltransferase involved in cell wall biosynthesis